MNTPTCSFDSFTKVELDELADRLLENDPIAIEWCVTFIQAETFGIGHNRRRAKMARRLKHYNLSKLQRSRLVRAILARLVSGQFTQQFKDQLRLILHQDSKQVCDAAMKCRESEIDHVRRYAAWVLTRKAVVTN